MLPAGFNPYQTKLRPLMQAVRPAIAQMDEDFFNGPAPAPSAAAVADAIPKPNYLSPAQAASVQARTPAAAPAAPAAPATFGSKVGGAAKSVGAAIANNPMQAVSVLQGVAGAISYGTAKAPKQLGPPPAYNPNIRGAQGMEATGYEQARQDILTGQSNASQPGSADASTGVIQRLLAQREAGRALGALAVQNNGAFQADVRRVDGQQQAVYDKNYTQQQDYRTNKYNEDRRLYEARRMQSQAQVQGAIDSVGAAYQTNQQDKQLTLESKNRQSEASIKQLHNDLASATSPQEVQLLLGKLKELDPTGIRTQQATTRYGARKFGAGGTIPTGFVDFKPGKAAKSSTSTRTGTKAGRGGADKAPVSVQTYHQMSKDFANQISKFGQQATQHFQRSLETAMRLRSTPIPSMGRATSRNAR